MKSKDYLLVVASVVAMLGRTVFAEQIVDTAGLELVDLTAPVNTAPTKSVSGSAILGGYGCDKLFDNITKNDASRWIATSKPASVTYEFESATCVNAFGFAVPAYGKDARSPKKFTFEGSNDGSAWHLLTSEDLSGKSWSNNEWVYFHFDNNNAYTQYRLTVTETNGDDQNRTSLEELDLYCIRQTTSYTVSGSPNAKGPVSPTYGTGSVPTGEPITFSAFTQWTSATGDEKATCSGYTIYTKDSESGEFAVWKVGSEASVSFEAMPMEPIKVEWNVVAQAKIVVEPAANGSVSFNDRWYDWGGTAEVSATPDDGYVLSAWVNTDTGTLSTSNPLTVTCNGPVHLRPVFSPEGSEVRYVSPTGDDEADGSISCPFSHVARAVESLSGAGGLVYVAEGEYVETSLVASTGTKADTAIVLAAPVQVIGMGRGAAQTVIKPSATNKRLFYLNHADARVQNLTVSGGFSEANKGVAKGGNVYIGASGGTLADCIVADGTVRTYNAVGGNIYMEAGHVMRCIIRNGVSMSGYASTGGGGLNAGGESLVENCLFTGNRSGDYSGNSQTAAAAVRLYNSAKLVNSTLVGNGTINSGYGACYVSDSAQVVNCAIFGNFAKVGVADGNTCWGGVNANYIACAADVTINDSCIRLATPNFTDAENGDYTLSTSSGLRDVGTAYTVTGAQSALDLAGNERVFGTAVDIGCYEYAAMGLAADFSIAAGGYVVPAMVVCNAVVEGSTGAVSYVWDIRDGIEAHAQHLETTVPAVSFTCQSAGYYTITLTATSGEDSVSVSHTLQISPETIFVMKGNAAAEYPYDTEQTAAATITEALEAAMDGATIKVFPGEAPYEEPEISVTKNVCILGESGETAVVVKSTSGRAFRINAARAIVANMTVMGKDSHTGNGGAVLIWGDGGTLSNCVVHCSSLSSWNAGGTGVACSYGLVTHCVISGFGRMSTGDNYDNGVAVRLDDGARLENSLVTNVTTVIDRAGGHIVSAHKSSVVNCTIADSRVPEVCVKDDGNPYGSEGVGLFCDSMSTVKNTVVYNVTGAGGISRPWAGTAENFVSCATDGGAAINVTCKLVSSDDFAGAARGDFTPARTGVLYNAGMMLDLEFPLTDLVGNPRLQMSKVDIGCYEFVSRAGLAIVLR